MLSGGNTLTVRGYIVLANARYRSWRGRERVAEAVIVIAEMAPSD
jgi:hypothetical protein